MAGPVTIKFNTLKFTNVFRRMTREVTTRAEDEVGFAANSTNLDIVFNSPVDTGDFQAAWSKPFRIAPLHWSAGENRSPQAFALEYGSIPGQRPWPHVGPKTVRGGGTIGEGFQDAAPNIYSSQAPIGMVRRALATQAPIFRRQILALVRRAWERT